MVGPGRHGVVGWLISYIRALPYSKQLAGLISCRSRTTDCYWPVYVFNTAFQNSAAASRSSPVSAQSQDRSAAILSGTPGWYWRLASEDLMSRIAYISRPVEMLKLGIMGRSMRLLNQNGHWPAGLDRELVLKIVTTVSV